MKGAEWWKPDVELSEISNDLVDILEQTLLEDYRKKLELAYEKGEIDEIDFGNAKFDDEVYKKFEERVSKDLHEIWDNIPKSIQNCVISGTRKALSSSILANDVAKALDTSEIINDNNLVKYVRVELQTLYSDIISTFAKKLSNTINELLQEI